MMNINALPSSGWYTPSVNGSNSANSKQNTSPSSSTTNNNSDAAAAAALQSTQVTLSASASMTFSDLPSDLGLSLNTQYNPFTAAQQQSGSSSSSSPSSATGLLGQFAESELASQLTSPSELNGATVTFNSFSAQSTSSTGYAQQTSSGQGSSQSATVLEASQSDTLQGSGEITLANGEVIQFSAQLNTSASVVEGSATQSTDGATNSAATSGTTPSNTSSSIPALNLPTADSTQPTSKKATTAAPSEWSLMLQQYNLLLNLFDSVKSAVDGLQAPQNANSSSATSPASSASSASTATSPTVSA